ncbi:MAG: 3-deoxy-7-phosphoheptulonate synthase, partial [Cutibacterium granulosum]|nr:3-deoxy-7-phosphoheptulonate synthase [Cutibacterium granulosum]
MPTPVPTLESLRAMPVEQQPRYSDPQQRRRVVQRLRVLAPLVRARQCDELRSRLADVAGG